MDSIFFDRLNTKIRQSLSMQALPDASTGLANYVHRHLEHNGKLLEAALALVSRYWERAQPGAVGEEAAAHEKVLIALLDENRKLLEYNTDQFLSRQPQFATENPAQDINIHYDVYKAKVRDEIALLAAVRRREISELRKRLLIGAAVPIVCVLLSAWLANDARVSLKEVNSVRGEMAALARSSLVASSLILDGADRISAPAHKLAAQIQMQEVENRLAPFYPRIHQEIEASIRKANIEAERFWKQYEKVPPGKQDQFLKDYIERKGEKAEKFY